MVEHSEPVPPGGRRGLALRRRDVAVLTAALVVLGVLLYLLIRPAANTGIDGSSVSSTHGAYAGLAETRPLPAPPLKLDNYLGAPFDLAAYRGRAVFVTFLYTHCPDVCPVITSHLHTALTQMSAAERRRVTIVAVSVDPRGDTRRSVAQFLREHEMTGRMQYLLGSAAALGRVWRAWGVSSSPQTANPELVAHSALIYGISAQGKVTVIYPGQNFSPSEIVHDAPLLARS